MTSDAQPRQFRRREAALRRASRGRHRNSGIIPLFIGLTACVTAGLWYTGMLPENPFASQSSQIADAHSAQHGSTGAQEAMPRRESGGYPDHQSTPTATPAQPPTGYAPSGARITAVTNSDGATGTTDSHPVMDLLSGFIGGAGDEQAEAGSGGSDAREAAKKMKTSSAESSRHLRTLVGDENTALDPVEFCDPKAMAQLPEEIRVLYESRLKMRALAGIGRKCAPE